MRELFAEVEGIRRGRRGDTHAAAEMLECAAVAASVAGENVAVIAFLCESIMAPLRRGVAGLDDVVPATLQLAA